jgi:hypothetical protein
VAGGVLKYARHLEVGPLLIASARRIGGDQALIGLDQEQKREAEHQLHARAPEVVELHLEHAQRVGDDVA